MVRPISASDTECMCVLQSSTPSVSAGGEISRGKFGFGRRGRGTAGLIVRKKGSPSGALVLTCAHVLGTPAIGEDASIKNDNLVYSPRFEEHFGVECNRPLGTVVSDTLPKNPEDVIQAGLKVGDEIFAVDAALIQVVDDATAINEVPIIGQIQGVRDLIQEWSLTSVQQALELPQSKQIAVKKYGATTRYTEGTVRRLARQHVKEFVGGQQDPLENEALVFEIEVNPGQNLFTREYELDMDRFASRMGIVSAEEVAALFAQTNVNVGVGGSAKKPTLKVAYKAFSQPGDSGAPIVDKDSKIVGILRSGTIQLLFVKGQDDPIEIDIGNSQGVFIGAALEKLQVTFLSSGQQTAGARTIVPGMPVEIGSAEALSWTALDQLPGRIENSRLGKHLVMTFRPYFDELRQLVHHRRRVMVTWHRYKGPSFIAAVLRAAERKGRSTPTEIDGVRLADLLRAMCATLRVEGSPGLRRAVGRYEHKLLELANDATSFEELLSEQYYEGTEREAIEHR